MMSVAYLPTNAAIGGVPILQSVAWIGGIITALTAVGKACVIIKQGEVGIRTKFGRVKTHDGTGLPIVKGAGLHWVFVGWHSLKAISVQDRALDLVDFAIEHERKLYNVKASIVWKVRSDGDNPKKAFFDVVNLEETIGNECSQALRCVLLRCWNADHQRFDANELLQEMHDESADTLLRYGVELVEVNLRQCAPDPAQILAQAVRGEEDATVVIATKGLSIV